MTDVERFLSDSSRWVAQALDRWLPTEAEAGPLGAAMRHITLANGKRLRPALVLLGAEDVGGTRGDALGAAAALEVVHAYSLVHDDLPCMDDARLRRGRPCVHVVHGEALAVLAGDALLTLAFELLARHTPSERPLASMVAILAEAAGWRGMVGGQAEDLAAEGGVPDVERVRRIHLRKTAALLSAALRIGGLAGGGGPADVERLGAVGRDLGLAFQIADDLLDADGSSAATGKDSGVDAPRGKMTWPSAVGRQAAREEARALAERAANAARGGRSAEMLAALARWVVDRER